MLSPARATVLACLAASPVTFAQVCNTPSDSYPLIQDALDDIACDTVAVSAGVHDTDLRIERPVNLVGAAINGTVIRGTGTTSAVTITDGPTVLSDLTISGGSANQGAGILANVADGTPITAARIRLTDNTAASGGAAADVGQASFRLLDSLVDRNVGGGVISDTITIDGGVIIERSRFIANTNSFAVQVFRLTMRNSIVSNNRADTAIVSYSEGSVEHSTISNNISDATQSVCGGVTVSVSGSIVASTIANNVGPGGGVCSITANPLTITNSTISGNRGTLYAGGLSHSFRDFGAETILEHVSLVDNVGRVADSIGLIAGQVRLRATVVAGAAGGLGDCFAGFGDVASFGSNLATDDTCNLIRDSDQVAVADAGLGPLADNGGDTLTHALLPGSPAIDGVASDNCPDADQRGVLRPQGAACDVGAFEADGAL